LRVRLIRKKRLLTKGRLIMPTDMPLQLLILEGDGISQEIMTVARQSLDVVNQAYSLNLDIESEAVGLESIAQFGTAITDEAVERAREADGVVLGPVSTYDYPPAEVGGINPSAVLRIALNLYANIRPSEIRQGVSSVARELDLVVVRENTEGFYADRNMAVGSGEFQPSDDMALAVRKITRQACRRIAMTAFELARQRRRQVTMVHKANVLKLTDGLFVNEVREVSKAYPDIALNEMIIDAMTAKLVLRPEAFDVIVTTNMYGDILSDEAAALSGGLGLAGALNVGDEHAMAQAVHGSAPDIAGQGIANPSSILLSCAMLLAWLSQRKQQPLLGKAAVAINRAVNAVLANRAYHTPDLGGSATTLSFSSAVLDALQAEVA
jgi:3-isopropylmalate dehydrogenase